MKTKLDQQLSYAINQYNSAMILECVNQGADVNTKGKSQVTALHVAAIRGNSDLVQVLLEKKALVDALDENNSTPLLYAFTAGEAVSASILIKSGANPNLENNEENSATKISKSKHCSSRLLDAIAGKEVLSYQQTLTRQREASGKDSSLHLS